MHDVHIHVEMDKDNNHGYRPPTGAPSKGVSGVMQTQTSPKDPKQPDADKGEKKTMLVLSGGEGYIDFRIGTCKLRLAHR